MAFGVRHSRALVLGASAFSFALMSSGAAFTQALEAETVTRTYKVDGGSASLTYTAPTADGSHTVVVTDTDLAGNAASGSLTFMLDKTADATPPATVVVNGTADDVINNSEKATVSMRQGLRVAREDARRPSRLRR